MNEDTSLNPEPLGSPAINPVQPLPEETAEAFEAFLLFFESGQKLTYPRLAEALGVHLNTIYNWSAKYEWRARILRHRTQLLSYKQRAEQALKKQEALSQVELARVAREHKIRTLHKIEAAADTLLDDYMVNGIQKTRLGELSQFYALYNRICGTFDPKSKTLSPATDPQLKAAEEQYLADVAQAYKIAEEMESLKEAPPKEEPPKQEPPKNP